MNRNNPLFWALIGFGVGAVVTAAGSIATPLDSLIGGLIQAVIWYGVAKFILNRRKKSELIVLSSDPSTFTRSSDDGYIQVKICDQCEKQVPMEYTKCYLCQGSSFTHKRVHFSEAVTKNSQNYDPEFKVCPMCAEEIKFAAKKCRYCQHLLEI